jgi:GT2 family glycosyltransferase
VKRHSSPLGPVEVSVVIPTFRRPEDLRRLVRSLYDGDVIPDEIIVVNNDPAGSCPEVTGVGAGRLVVLEAGLGLNLAGARNLGWKSATGGVVFFVDDDNVVARDAVGILACMALHAHVGLVAPIMRSPAGQVLFAGTRRSMWTTRTRFVRREINGAAADMLLPTDDAPNAFAMRRDVLESIGGFDEKHFPFHYDEADLAERVRAAGLEVVVAPRATVWHSGAIVDPGEELVRAYRIHGAERIRRQVKSRVLFHWRWSRGFQRMVALGVGLPLYVLVAWAYAMRRAASWREGMAIGIALVRGAIGAGRE